MDNIIYLVIFNVFILLGLLFLIFKKNSNREEDKNFDN